MDLTQLTAIHVGLIAAIATVTSATVASLTAILVASINRKAAMLMAREQALREYRKSTLDRFLKLADGSFLFVHKLAILAKVGDISELERHADGIQDEKNIVLSLEYIPTVNSDSTLNEAAKRFCVLYNAALDESVSVIVALRRGEACDTAQLERLAQQLMPKAVALRMAAEDFICSTTRSQQSLQAIFATEPEDPIEALRRLAP